MERALFEILPSLERRLPWLELGELPTPVEALPRVASAVGAGAELYVKRDDLTSPVYGGNKVRTLELLFAEARRRKASRIYATGAFGSNHATATVLHAPRVGLEPGVVLFAQPPSQTALENFRVSLARARDRVVLPHWSLLPFGMMRARLRSSRQGHRSFVMVPGGATPLGALGYVSAGLELAMQVRRHECPALESVVVGVGSTCTSAGLLVGLTLAARLGLGFARAPELRSVRVSPWPVTARARILSLAERTAALLAELAGDRRLAFGARELGARFVVDPNFLGPGYGLGTKEGREATALFGGAGFSSLDSTYSAKSAAGVVAALRRGDRGPLLYWATKSSAPLPNVEPSELESAGSLAARFVQRCAALRSPDGA
jgi:D-cysteine desulfhydrase